jgi:hypothetical protein
VAPHSAPSERKLPEGRRSRLANEPNRLRTIQLLRCPKRPRSLLRQSTTRRGNAPASQDAPDRHRLRDRPGRPDQTVHSGQWDVGRIYETRGGLQLLVFEDGVKDPVDRFQSRATPLLMARSIASTLSGNDQGKDVAQAGGIDEQNRLPKSRREIFRCLI